MGELRRTPEALAYDPGWGAGRGRAGALAGVCGSSGGLLPQWPDYRCVARGGGPTLPGDTTEAPFPFAREAEAAATGLPCRETPAKRETPPVARPLCEMRCKPLLVCRSLPVLSDPLSATGNDRLRTLSGTWLPPSLARASLAQAARGACTPSFHGAAVGTETRPPGGFPSARS